MVRGRDFFESGCVQDRPGAAGGTIGRTDLAGRLTVGAISLCLLGCAAAVNILTPSATVRRIVNLAALTVVEANATR